MAETLPEFPYCDNRPKTIALLGYTGVGKTSLLTAGYFQNLFHCKDAFTKRFFQRIEDELKVYGEIPLTLGEASTLSFIEPHSRNEFSIQDFSGEHIKLERKEEENYQRLIERANHADALICMLSASSFYQKNQSYEEIDAIQTFINKLRSLGSRMPVIVVLTKCDAVPRFFINLPMLKPFSKFISKLPFMKVSPGYGLELTQKRFPKIFAGFDFSQKGPKTVVSGIAFPRLGSIKAWHWPKWLRWFPLFLKRLFGDPKWLFQNAFQLETPFNFCFQAFQLGIVRDLLVYHHKKEDYTNGLMNNFKMSLIETENLGKDFYCKEYFDRIIDDTHSIIEDVDKDIEELTQNSHKLLKAQRELPQNLSAWLTLANEKIQHFNKSWSEGAKQTLTTLRKDTLLAVKEQLAQKLSFFLEEPEKAKFLQIIEILQLRLELEKINIWKEEAITLPDDQSLQQQLIRYLVKHIFSLDTLTWTVYEENKLKYQQVLTISEALELETLEQLVKQIIDLQKNIENIHSSGDSWEETVLKIMAKIQKNISVLTGRFSFANDFLLFEYVENMSVDSLFYQIDHFKDFSQTARYITELKQYTQISKTHEKLKDAHQKLIQNSQKQLLAVLNELEAQSQQIVGQNMASHLKEWLETCHNKMEKLRSLAGEEALDNLENLQSKVLKNICQHLNEKLEQSLQGSARTAFVQIGEVLQTCREMEKMEIFARFSLTLPTTDIQEQAFARHLVSTSLALQPLNISVYQQHYQQFQKVIRHSPPAYIEELTRAIESYQNLQDACHKTSLHPGSWVDTVFAPLQGFHSSWLELKVQFESLEEFSIKKQMEQMTIGSLWDLLPSVKLEELRNWVGKVRPLIATSEYKQQLEELMQQAQQEIFGQFQGDLQEFMDTCDVFSKESENIKKYMHAKTYWQNFSGKLKSLEISNEKFPHSELNFDEKTRQMYGVLAPKKLEEFLHKWAELLQKLHRFNKRECRQIAIAIDMTQKIFGRPGMSQTMVVVLNDRKSILQKRGRIGRVFLVLLCLIAVYGVWYMQKQKRQIQDLETKRQQMISEKISLKQISHWEHTFEKRLDSPVNKTTLKVREVLLEARAFTLWQKLKNIDKMSKAQHNMWLQELQHLEQQDKFIRENKLFFRSHFLPKIRKKLTQGQ